MAAAQLGSDFNTKLVCKANDSGGKELNLTPFWTD